MQDVLRNFNLDTYEAAIRMGITRQTMQRWRKRGYGPKYLKVGKEYRYSEREIVSWLGEYNEWLKKAE
jgi:predicted site-specific integrase-resolvase